jgi:lysophospholipase L1-like esterase
LFAGRWFLLRQFAFHDQRRFNALLRFFLSGVGSMVIGFSRISQATVLLLLLVSSSFAAEPLTQDWDYAPAMKKVAAASPARDGVVLHVGDSITHANPYGQWARFGQGHSDDDKAVLKWMHTGAADDTDGWHLAAFDVAGGGRSYTAAGGMRSDELLTGGKAGLPSLGELLKTYKPQIVLLMLGTNDASQGRKVEDYRRDSQRAVETILAAGAIPILSTIPPHIGREDLSKAYNQALREIARERELPLIDYEREIYLRRPKDWNGTLLSKDDVHPTASRERVSASSEPTDDNLKQSGYLLRGWLSVRKIAEVKQKVLAP